MTAKLTTEAFALTVVQRLHQAGYDALWAGGCVRDQLLGRTPKDYDVATNATPDQVRDVFGRRRTLMIGAAFGVVAVLGSKRSAQPVEVATFRQDGGYSDGRHPDRVTFSTAEEDAKRRDFTINGLFYDPVTQTVFDYVGGRDDLHQKRIRCIGDPAARFSEDKLRMLRAVRFSTDLGFEIETETRAAIQKHAAELRLVSAERIAAEMRRILVHPRAAVGLTELQTTNLIRVVLPEFAEPPHRDQLHQVIGLLDRVNNITPPIAGERSFALALATLLRNFATDDARCIHRIARRWKLANQERDDCHWLLHHVDRVVRATELLWPDLQPILVDPRVHQLLMLATAIVETESDDARSRAGIAHCQNKLSLPPSCLNPKPLVNGHDLIRAGLAAGKQLGALLSEIRRLQLLGRLTTRDEAICWAKSNVSK